MMLALTNTVVYTPQQKFFKGVNAPRTLIYCMAQIEFK
jgi:hypothetical protein